MNKMKNWGKRFMICYRQYGIKYTLVKTCKRIKRKIFGGADTLQVESHRNKRVVDVLFVNGCDPVMAPHPHRYRVTHQREQLESAGVTTDEVFYIDFDPFAVCYANVILFYRCPYTPMIGEGIKIAKDLNKRVLYDIDDLVIDTKYTDSIPAVQKMNRDERALYDDGVVRMGATLKLCEAGITTTQGLQQEMLRFVPDVYINRNCASEEMMGISENVCNAMKQRDIKNVVIGYFSGSLTHNADFELIKEQVIRILDENSNVKLLVMGELELPQDLRKYRKQIIQKPFMDWRKLPEIIGMVDINLAPLEDSTFNRAKSENKWVEAALVNVVTVASKTGAFCEAIKHGETGYLCEDHEWYDTLTMLIGNRDLRNRVAHQARVFCKRHYSTIGNASGIKQYIQSKAAKRIAFVLPSDKISGGIMVTLYHACILQDYGWSVDILVPQAKEPLMAVFNHRLSCTSFGDNELIEAFYDVIVATMWTTVEYVEKKAKAAHKCYLVQNYETDFYHYGDAQRKACESTYYNVTGLRYLTISKWCEQWLKERYHQNASYMRNGIELRHFTPLVRTMDGEKVRILIEGDSAVDYKNVDESFAIIDQLDPKRYEVWYMSYNGSPKPQYRVDRFLQAVPYEKTGEVYRQCDILLKSSWLESFSYPPLEMMATGGFCVVAPNAGNQEYLVHEKNCLLYKPADIHSAVEAIERIVMDKSLQKQLYENGIKTAKSREWTVIEQEIVETYNSIIASERKVAL